MSENAEITKGKADPIDHLVSRRLKIRRMMLGYSQQELSEAADVSIQQVQKYEKATNRISSGKLYSFSKFLKVPVNYFFDQEDTTLESIFAEDHEEYGESQPNNSSVTEKEVIALVKAFCEIKDIRIRKKIIELIKSMS